MLAPPKPPVREPEALIPEARERQRRRRVVMAASVASVAGLVLLGHALLADSGAKGTAAGAAGASAPTCRPSQLAFSAFTGPGYWMNGLETQMYIADTGGSACALPAGLPTATFIVSGKPVPTRQSLMPPPYDAFGPRAGHTLEPGRKYYYVLGFGNLCARGTAFERNTTSGTTTVALRFSDGLRVSAESTTPENNGPLAPECGGFVISPLLHWSS